MECPCCRLPRHGLPIHAGLSVTYEGNREDYFPELLKWASDNGASAEGFEMVNFKDEGFGLRATRDIKVSTGVGRGGGGMGGRDIGL